MDELELMTFTEPDYIEIFTSSGTIRLVYELSLGDLLIGTLLCLILLFSFIRAVFNSLWR